MGRKRDGIWNYVDTVNGKVKCKFCGHKFSGGASRIKWHLSGIKGKGVINCSMVPEDVQSEASLAFDDSSKRVKSNANSSNLDDNIINSNLTNPSSKGKYQSRSLPTTDLVGEQFQGYRKQILEWLIEDEKPIIGVWGMGGVGKTTLLKNIHNEVLESFDVFDHIIWVTLTQNCSIRQLHRTIAKSFDINVSEEDEEHEIAAKLKHAFNKISKCLIILDDVWFDIILENVGIPLTSNRIRLILTSRSFDVCQSMGCEKNIVQVKPLCDDDAWDLFSENLGDYGMLPRMVREIARSMVKACDGLPLAIVTIARSMRGKSDIRDWRCTLAKLSNIGNGEDNMKRCVFPTLKSSFDYLNDEKLRECILYLALYPEYESIKREDLIRNFVDEGLIDGKQALEAQFDQGHSMLNKLKNNSLLEEREEEEEECSVKLHRLLRAMVVNIAKEYGYMAEAGQELTKLPCKQKWKRKLQKVSLDSKIQEIPSGMSPMCPQLSTLLLRGTDLKLIPETFFINLLALKVLDLSYSSSIEVLPMCISNLESLRSLLLAHCKSLRCMPSLARLQKLMRLDLSYTAITEVPEGLETLINLRWLNLEGTKRLKMSPALWLPQLVKLQSLYLNIFSKSMDVKSRDLEELNMLKTISANFHDQDEFNDYVKIVQAGNFRSYFLLLLGTYWQGYEDYIEAASNDAKVVRVEGIKGNSTIMLPIDINVLEIHGCNQWKSLCDVSSFHQSNNRSLTRCNIRRCKISDCDELEHLFCCSISCSLCSSLQPWTPLSNIKHLSIHNCSSIIKLLTPEMFVGLEHLESIDVQCCESMEEIFSSVRSTDSEIDIDEATNPSDIPFVFLPKLKSVTLEELPQLNSVCKVILACPSLEVFKIVDCLNLERVPQILPPFAVDLCQFTSSPVQSTSTSC